MGLYLQRGTEMHHLIGLLESVNVLLVNMFTLKSSKKISVYILVIFEECQF